MLVSSELSPYCERYLISRIDERHDGILVCQTEMTLDINDVPMIGDAISSFEGVGKLGAIVTGFLQMIICIFFKC